MERFTKLVISRMRLLQGALAAGATIVILLVAIGDLPAAHALTIWLAVAAGGLVTAGLKTPALPQLIATSDEPPVGGLLDAVSDAVILVDARLQVRLFNASAKQTLPHLKVGDPIHNALRVPDILDALRQVIESGGKQRIGYMERVPVERAFEAEIIAIPGITPTRVLLVLRDVTESNRIDRMRSDFVANASHELRTPLASVVGFIDTLQGSARDDPAARERFLAIMREQATRMSRLIDDLLSLSRIEMIQHVKPDAPVDLVTVVGQVIDALHPLAKGRGIELEVISEPESLIVAGDRDELMRAFENLIENAIKYGGSGQWVGVWLETTADGKSASISVRDRGPGIAAEHLPRLTERFYRIDAGQSREKGGTGLGLAIVKHILARHRGQLTIKSELGKGATFTVVLQKLDRD